MLLFEILNINFKMYLLGLLCCCFYNNFLLNSSSYLSLYFLHVKPSTGNFFYTAQLYRLFTSDFIRYPLTVQVLLKHLLDILAMLILVLRESKQDGVHKSWHFCCESFQINVSVIMFCSASKYQDIFPYSLFQNLPNPFCMFVVSIRDVLHCQIAVGFFLLWQWCFTESLASIQALVIDKCRFPTSESISVFHFFLLNLH